MNARIQAPALGAYRFTFAVIADTHMNQKEDYSSSPYPANALANARTRRVIAELNQHAPEFVVHLGDIVNPVPELPTYEDAAGHFKAQVANLDAPLHLVPGNHDVGDKPVAWMPAGTVADEHLALYEAHFGRHYFSFGHQDLQFIVINAPIINSGLAAEAEQRVWLEAELAAGAGKRTFIAIHYPPYVTRADERGSYDNLDEPGRGWLLSLIEQHAPEAVFCGHVHNFWYDRIDRSEMYILPSTAFVRHDFSELYRVGPGDQNGRNDGPKLGYFLVRVYEGGHVVENIRSYGRCLDPDQALPPPIDLVARPQPKEARFNKVAMDLRQPWAEELEVAPSGAVDEFERKRTRNDYPVLALWEMGLKRLRVPLHDLLDDRVAHRMAVMLGAGHEFQVHCYGLPEGTDRERLLERADRVACLELVINWDRFDELGAHIAALAGDLGRPIVLSRVNRKNAAKHIGGRYNHLISHGFTLAEAEELQALCDSNTHAAAISGFMLTVSKEQCPVAVVVEAGRLAQSTNKSLCLYIKTTGDSPAADNLDEVVNNARFAAAVAAAAGTPGVSVVLDTFADADRGYFARSGVVDRRHNPKLGSHVLGNLIGLFDGDEWLLDGAHEAAAHVTVVRLRSASGQRLWVCLDAQSATLAHADAQPPFTEWVDLATGRMQPLGNPGTTDPAAGFQVLCAGDFRRNRRSV